MNNWFNKFPSSGTHRRCNLGRGNGYPISKNGTLLSMIHHSGRLLGHSDALSLQFHSWMTMSQCLSSCHLHLLPKSQILDHIWGRRDLWRSKFSATLLLHQLQGKRSTNHYLVEGLNALNNLTI